jgi:F0F1-type ATP synthase assembly protein I
MPFPVRGQTAGEPAPETPDLKLAAEPASEPKHQLNPEAEGIHSSYGPPPPLAEYTPPTAGETIRMSGLAWSAGIMLFGSIAFLTVIGWFADLLIGSSPWGVVAGVVVGSVIGFVQLFRINAEILKITNRKKQPSTTSTLSLTDIKNDLPATEDPDAEPAVNIDNNSPTRD